jgi:hypothetical protein
MVLCWEGNVMATKVKRTIIQIVPVEGWAAVYAIRPEEHENNPVWVCPLACWALVQEGVQRYVVGLDRTLSFCEAGDNFLGYLPPGENPAGWKEEALRNLRDPKATVRPKRPRAPQGGGCEEWS